MIVSKALAGSNTYLGSDFDRGMKMKRSYLQMLLDTLQDRRFWSYSTIGVLSAGDSISIDLLYSTFGISGEYSGALTIISNDPNSSSVEAPASISVTGVPDIMVMRHLLTLKMFIKENQ